MKAKTIIGIIMLVLMAGLVSAAPGDPTPFLNSTLGATAWVGGDAGTGNFTGDLVSGPEGDPVFHVDVSGDNTYIDTVTIMRGNSKQFRFYNDTGTQVWGIYLSPSENFIIRDYLAGENSILINPNGAGITISPAITLSDTLTVGNDVTINNGDIDIDADHKLILGNTGRVIWAPHTADLGSMVFTGASAAHDPLWSFREWDSNYSYFSIDDSGITAGVAMDMGNYVLENLGDAGTDFDSSGGLTTAGDITVNNDLILGRNNLDRITGKDTSDNEISILWVDSSNQTVHRTPNNGKHLFQIGVATKMELLNDGRLDMKNNEIINIGNAGTDFGPSGELTIANTLTMGGTYDIVISNNGYGMAWGSDGGSPRIFGTSAGNLSVKHGDGSSFTIFETDGDLTMNAATIDQNENNPALVIQNSGTAADIDFEDGQTIESNSTCIIMHGATTDWNIC